MSVIIEPTELASCARPWKPHKYQMRCVEWLVGHGSAGLFLDPGLGKTSITLRAIQALKQSKVLRRALVIAPLRVLYQVWPLERDQWTNFHGLSMALIHGSKKIHALNADADVYLINREGLKWFTDNDGWNKIQADTLVVDESTKFKATNTQGYKILRPQLPTFSRRWILTGSPMPNGYMDLFGQMYIMDLGRSLGQYITHFKREYFVPLDRFGWEWVLAEGSKEAIDKRIATMVVRLAAEDYIDMPERIEKNIVVQLPADAREIYDAMHEDMLVELEGKTNVALNTLAVANKCSQIANGGLFHELDTENSFVAHRSWTKIHDEKTDALRDLVEELQGSPLLVAVEFLHDVQRIRAALGKDIPYFGSGMTPNTATSTLAKWNAGKLPLLLGHPASMGHGLNMQHGPCKHICFYGITWNYELYDQFIRRVQRQGSGHAEVFVHHIIADNTIDRTKMAALRGKARTQNRFFEALKAEAKRRKQRV